MDHPSVSNEDCVRRGNSGTLCEAHLINGLRPFQLDDLGINTDLSQTCPIHRNKIQTFFCPTHDQIMCDTCVKISHRQCHEVKRIDDICEGISTTEEFKRIKGVLSSLENETEKNLKIVSNRLKDVDDVYDNALNELMNLFEGLRERDKKKLESISNTSETIRDEIRVFKKSLDQVGDKKKFVTMKTAAGEIEKFDQSLVTSARDTIICRYGFVPQETRDTNHGDNVLGKICIFPIKLQGISIETQSDRHDCSVSGLVLLGNGKLVVIDNGNKKVKLFDVNARHLIAELPLATTPMGVTRVNDKEVIVTSATETKVLVLSIKERITIQRHFELKGFSQKIGFSDSNYLVSFSDLPLTQVINNKGYVMKTIKTEQGENCQQSPKAVSFNQNSTEKDIFFMADSGENKVLRMKQCGDVISQFEATDMKYPIDIAHGRDGSIYVCCRDSENIFKLSGDFSVGHVILNEEHGLISPWCISICQDRNILYIGSYGGKHIQIFKL